MEYSEIMVTDRNSDYDELLQQVGKGLKLCYKTNGQVRETK